jgi:hypothetical protein
MNQCKKRKEESMYEDIEEKGGEKRGEKRARRGWWYSLARQPTRKKIQEGINKPIQKIQKGHQGTRKLKA